MCEPYSLYILYRFMYDMISKYTRFFFTFLLFLTVGCSHTTNLIKDIHIGLHNNNRLRIQVDVNTIAKTQVYAAYWPDSAQSEKLTTATSQAGLYHSFVLTNILPGSHYSYQLFTVTDGKKEESKIYHFQSELLPPWLQNQFKATAPAPQLLPKQFVSGFLLLNKRESPGFSYIVDTKGRLRWYNMVDGTGIKVTHFTNDTTVLSILGTNDEPTSYGSEILEVNLKGDTLVHLTKGEGDFRYTIHHEIIKNSRHQLVTLYVDKRVLDLRSVGGNIKDTVAGDGILVMDNHGKKIWQWSVFDASDPLKDKDILKTKKDWMHANSLSFDKDSNYLMSFYNNGQIWKINSRTGAVMWKFGKNGTFAMPADCEFSMAHAAHINPNGDLMFFNNGIDKHQSEVYAIKLNEAAQTAQTDLHIKLPQEVYNDRMGSAYMVGDSAVLVCCSKHHISILTNRQGVLLWTLDTAIPPYRVEFINQEKVGKWLLP